MAFEVETSCRQHFSCSFLWQTLDLTRFLYLNKIVAYDICYKNDNVDIFAITPRFWANDLWNQDRILVADFCIFAFMAQTVYLTRCSIGSKLLLMKFATIVLLLIFSPSLRISEKNDFGVKRKIWHSNLAVASCGFAFISQMVNLTRFFRINKNIAYKIVYKTAVTEIFDHSSHRW